MSEMKHTPGPWSVYEWSGHRSISAEDSASGFSFEAGGYRLPLCDLEGDIEEAAANARLIAAAPELLEALREVYDALGTSYPLHSCDMDRRGFILSKARAAIAKATGVNDAK